MNLLLNIKVFLYRVYDQIKRYGASGLIMNPFGVCILRIKTHTFDINHMDMRFVKKNMEDFMQLRMYSFSELNWKVRQTDDGYYEHRVLNASLKKHKDIYK